MRAFVLDGYGAIADHVRLAEIADPVPGPGDVQNRNPCRQPQSDRLQDRAWRPQRVSKYQLPRPFGFDASGVVTSVGARGVEIQAGRCGLCRASRGMVTLPKIALPKFVALKPAGLAAEAASLPLVGLTTLQMFAADRPRADPDPRRRRGVGTLRFNTPHLGLVTVDHGHERRMSTSSNRSVPTGSLHRPRELSRAGRRYDDRLRHARWCVHSAPSRW